MSNVIVSIDNHIKQLEQQKNDLIKQNDSFLAIEELRCCSHSINILNSLKEELDDSTSLSFDINSKLNQVIENMINFKKISLEFSKNTMSNIDKYQMLEDIDKYIEKDEIRVYMGSGVVNDYLLLSTISDMLKNGQAKIEFTDTANKDTIKYLEKLNK